MGFGQGAVLYCVWVVGVEVQRQRAMGIRDRSEGLGESLRKDS